MNLLTNELQCGYKNSKSTMDIIFQIKQNFLTNRSEGQILFDLTQAFGKINRDKLWQILYEKDYRLNLSKILLMVIKTINYVLNTKQNK